MPNYVAALDPGQQIQRQARGGFRVVVNNGASAGQSVAHLHIHVMAGRPFEWPPG